MTNERAISYLSQMYIMQFNENEHKSLTIAINSIQENTKLKDEIEQYKSALTTWNNANNEMLKFNQELKDKIEQLKEKIEKLDKYNSKLCMELTITMDKLCLAEKEIEWLEREKQ